MSKSFAAWQIDLLLSRWSKLHALAMDSSLETRVDEFELVYFRHEDFLRV